MSSPLRLAFFLLAVCALYVGVFFFFDGLRFPLKWDEPRFWMTSWSFKDTLVPSLDQLRNYEELNTPLPFIIYGAVQRFFQEGPVAGRMLNLALSFFIVVLIALPARKGRLDPILAACGMLSFPYFVYYSTLFYTDTIAAFFVLLGCRFYLRDQHLLSGLAFVLAIASRQFMLAFPLAIAAHELTRSLRGGLQIRRSWLVPLLAASTIFGWLWLFDGVAPPGGLAERNVPPVQQRLWAFTPDASLFFLACIGLYFVMPEFVLFRLLRLLRGKTARPALWTPKNGLIALGVLPLFLLFPPLRGHGLLVKIVGPLPDVLALALLYALVLITCLRFARLDLAFWMLLMHAGLMLKATPWDKYALPLLVAFWYLKAVRALDDPTPETRQDGPARPLPAARPTTRYGVSEYPPG